MTPIANRIPTIRRMIRSTEPFDEEGVLPAPPAPVACAVGLVAMVAVAVAAA
jgi:hypothetical protein